MNTDLETLPWELLTAYEPITLAEMNETRLLDRLETKYLFSQVLLTTVLSELTDTHRAFVAAGLPWSRNRTLYFDTAGMALYLRHHAGARERYKVRTREYLDSHLAFLEVKHKVGLNRTVKNRVPVVDPTDELGEQAAFLAAVCPYGAEKLRPKLWSYATRITLVSKTRTERVTLDVNLAFSWGDALVMLPGVVVAEVKYQGRPGASEFMGLMHRCHLRAAGFSKYCIGVSLLYPEIKHNNFKETQRQVARIAGTNGGGAPGRYVGGSHDIF